MVYTETIQSKESRIELRVNQDHKRLLEQAAAALGISTSSFILSNSLKAAYAEVAALEELVLSDRDRDRFLHAIDNPPKPKRVLKDAMNKFLKSQQ